MEDIKKLAWQIYEQLKASGCEIGDASVPIIERVVEQYIEQQAAADTVSEVKRIEAAK